MLVVRVLSHFYLFFLTSKSRYKLISLTSYKFEFLYNHCSSNSSCQAQCLLHKRRSINISFLLIFLLFSFFCFSSLYPSLFSGKKNYESLLICVKRFLKDIDGKKRGFSRVIEKAYYSTKISNIYICFYPSN